MYLDHLQNWLVYGHSLFIFLILALFWLSETGQIWGFRAFPGERMEGMPEILHADVSWPPSELISSRSRSVDFCNWFWHYFDLVKRVKLGVSGHFLEKAWREWPEILHADVSWPPSELISLWLRSGDFLILVLFWLSETGQIWGFQAFSGKPMEEIAWNFACWCILTIFRID